MNEFVTWTTLATIGGAVAMTALITQVTKELPGIVNIRTQLWSYLVALVVLFLATYFTHSLTLESALLVPFNAVIVCWGANGGFEAVQTILGGGHD